MLFLLALIVRTLARLLLRTGQDGTKDLEILVLRHHLRVLQRRTGPPKFDAIDRVLRAVEQEPASGRSRYSRTRSGIGVASVR